ncbi:hephaestin-like [Octopus sinensis]|uniref:Hephaestin-like n=1 Tax=Octopus sinensis TaxID=2607531 RepID=A0A7E6FJU5_9MOLL|nr:hephaestin-like [Octopus sinensis]
MPAFGSRLVLFSLPLLILSVLSPCCAGRSYWDQSAPCIREYFIAAIEKNWDYAPSGKDQVFASNESEKFLVNSLIRIGRIYKKVIYEQFTNGQFNKIKPKEKWMGLLGPVIRAEVGDTIVIHFRNMATREFSVHPHGVRYTKGNEGALYVDNTFGPLKKDEHVQPGESYMYTWDITSEFAPPAGDSACISWVYHSHINTPVDTNSGLIGPLITCKRGTLRTDGSRIDDKKEFILLAKTYDENVSFYSDENQKRCGDPNECKKLAEEEDEEYMDSNLMRTFNGYVYGNGPPFVLNANEEVIWYVMGMGKTKQAYTVFSLLDKSWYSTIEAMQASFRSATMKPMNPGRWLISCAVTEHYTDGALAFLDVKSQGTYTKNWRFPINNKIKYYYLSIEERFWDYAPSGKNNLTGANLSDDPNTEGAFTSGPHRIGRCYKKASFFQYKDSTFTTKIKTPDNMGLLGPVIRVYEGDKVVVVLKNFATLRPYSFLPHGVTYTKPNEGTVYNDSKIITGRIVKPGKKKTYEFFVPKLSDSDPMCKVFLYQSSVNHVRDLNSGLIGPLLICKRISQYIRPHLLRNHLEYFLLFNTFDENLSWYLDQNIQKFATDPQGVDVTNEDFAESNKKHGINGLVYANLPGLNMCVGDQVDWYVMSFGNEQDVHSPYFHGHTFQQENFREDTSNLIPAQSWTLQMTTQNPGRWLLECRTTIHFKEGMRAFYNVKICYNAPDLPRKTNIRRYFIAAEELRWDHAPKKRSIVTGNDLNNVDEDGNIYIRHNQYFIGSVYKKALFREYTDEKFDQRVVRDSSDVHLGVMGPIIRAEVGETIEVHFKNKASRPYSMLPHGLYFQNEEDGELYNASNPTAASKVMPNSTFKYTWRVPASSGPGAKDPNCISWHYISAVDPIKDVYSGLIGPIIICRKGILNNNEKRKDVDKEFVFLFWVLDENQSWYFKDNINYYAPGRKKISGDEDFEESNLFHSINGQIYGNNEGLLINVGDKVAWYLMSYGSENDVHVVHLHGQTFINKAGMRQRSDVITISPSTTRQVEFEATNPGTWFLHCHVNDHIAAGMETVYTILKKRSHLVRSFNPFGNRDY